MNRFRSSRGYLALALFFFLIATASAQEGPRKLSPFGWQFEEVPLRGGSSKGTPVTLLTEPHESWLALREEGLSEKERDRRAILALAGEFRASFEFVEVAGFTENYSPAEPYRSWGTEKVLVLENSPNRIVLQHVLVMKIEGKEPYVSEHWRQDWVFEPDAVLRYRGEDRWSIELVSAEQQKGAWSQTVYQVDDSPRYGGLGRWEHQAGFSSWSSDSLWRPLPRREYSVRSDYQVLSGVNRHIITPAGWTHEQENNKLVLRDGKPLQVIAREFGLNRYERLTGFDFSPAEHYMEATGAFWEAVREGWAERISAERAVELRRGKERGKLMMKAFRMAREMMESGDGPDEVELNQLLDSYLEGAAE